jgi:hypothetical protein
VKASSGRGLRRGFAGRFHVARQGEEIAFRQRQWPALKDLAVGAPEDVRNPNEPCPGAKKWGSRYQALAQRAMLPRR